MDPASTLQLTATPGFPDWLAEQNISLVLSTGADGKLIVLGRNAEGKLSAVERTFPRCTGLAVANGAIYAATAFQIWRFVNVLEPGASHEGYDALFVPRQAITTGDLGIHDLDVDKSGRILFAATRFNGIGAASPTHSFEPLWKPAFISAWIAEDRCHLSGLALDNGAPRFAACAAQSDTANGWHSQRQNGGVLIDIATGAVITRGLSLPHAPRIHAGVVWLLNSRTGEFGRIDAASGRFQPLAFIPGYARALAFSGPFAIVGFSLATDEPECAGTVLTERLAAQRDAGACGVAVIDLRSGAIAHGMRLQGLKHVAGVAVLPSIRRPSLLGIKSDEIQRLISLPTAPVPPQPRHDLLIPPLSDGNLDELRKQRRACAAWITTLNDEALAAPGERGAAYGALIRSGIQYAPLSAEETAELDAHLARANDPRRRLAALLYTRPSRFRAEWSFNSIPDAFVEPFVRYLFLPWFFVLTEEAEHHADTIDRVLTQLHDAIERDPDAPRHRAAAAAFLQHAAFVSLYFSRRNLRSIYERRAAILRSILTRSGRVLGWVTQPPLPNGRQRICVLLNGIVPGAESYLALAAFWDLDPARFATIVAVQTETGTDLEHRVRERADKFIVLPTSAAPAAQTLRILSLDTLIIATNVTINGTIFALAQYRLAHRQITLFSSPVTTGLASIDAFVSGKSLEPEGAEAHYTEHLELLDGLGLAFDLRHSPDDPGLSVRRADLGIADDAVVFASAANYFKVLPEVQEAWARILLAVPNSRLVLFPFGPSWTGGAPDAHFLRALYRRMAAAGIGPERMSVIRMLPNRGQLKSVLRLADVYLDSFPYGGSTSILEPLELALPIVARDGAFARARMSATMLRELKIPELVASTDDEYVALATKLGLDAIIRASFSARIRTAMEAVPAFLNPAAFARQIDEILTRPLPAPAPYA